METKTNSLISGTIWVFMFISSIFAAPTFPHDYNGWIVGSSSLPRPSDAMTVAYDNITDTIWLLGGFDGNGFHSLVGYQRGIGNFTDYGTSWLTLPEGIHGYGQYYGQLGSHLYIISYYYPNSSVHRFNVRNQQMDSNYYTIPVSVRSYGCLCLLDIDDRYLIINGGYDGSSYLATVQIFDMDSNQWMSNVPSLNTPRGFHSCNTFNNTIFVIGGSDDHGNNLDTVEVFNFYETEWKYTTDKLSTKMENVRSILYQNEIVVLGGLYVDDSSSSILDSINVINGITHQIYPVSSYIDIPLHLTAAINVAGTIYLFGGYNAGYLSSWRYVSPNSFSPTATPTNAPSNAPTNAPSNTPTSTPTISSNSPTKGPTLTGWIVKNDDFCQDGYMDVSKNNSLYGEYCEPCPDETAGKHGYCDLCQPPTKPNEERTECEGGNNVITFQTYLYTIFVLLGLVAITTIFAEIHSRFNKYAFDWKSLFPFLIYLFDAVSDLFFTVNLFSHFNDLNDMIYLILFILSLIFLLLPSLISVYSMERAISSSIELNDIKMTQYFGEHSSKLYITCFIIGNFTATLKLFGCNLMNLDIFKLSVPMNQMLLLENERFIYNLFSESIPQLIISIFYSIYSKNIFNNDVVIFTFIFGIISLLTSIFTFRTNRKVSKSNSVNQVEQYQMLGNDDDHIDDDHNDKL